MKCNDGHNYASLSFTLGQDASASLKEALDKRPVDSGAGPSRLVGGAITKPGKPVGARPDNSRYLLRGLQGHGLIRAKGPGNSGGQRPGPPKRSDDKDDSEKRPQT